MVMRRLFKFLMLLDAVCWIREVSWLLISMLELSEDFLIALRIYLKVCGMS